MSTHNTYKYVYKYNVILLPRSTSMAGMRQSADWALNDDIGITDSNGKIGTIIASRREKEEMKKRERRVLDLKLQYTYTQSNLMAGKDGKG